MEQPHPFHEFSPQNPESKTPDFEEQRHKHIVGKLKGTIFTALSASNPSRPISQELRCHIERRLHEFFPRFDIPSHPPYALMIQTAIMELNEEHGSIEESISGFIEKNYEDLPWGHASFLRHHLRKLCRMGEIVCKTDGRYMIAVGRGRVEEDCHVEVKEVEMINKQKLTKWKKQVRVFEEQHQVENQEGEEKNEASRQDTEATEQEIERTSVQLYDEEEKQHQHIKMNDEPSRLRELCFDVSDKHILACMQQNIPEEVFAGVTHEKKNKDQIMVTVSNASETIARSLNFDGLSTYQKEPCVELVKQTKFQERVIENSPLGGRELSKHNHCGPIMLEEKKDDLEVEQQQHARTPCPKRASDVKVIKGEKKLQEHHTESALGLCCVNREDLDENLPVSLGDSSLPVLKRQRKQLSKQQQQQKNIIWEENKFVIVCGLEALQRAPNSRLYNKQQQQSLDTTRAVFLPLEQQHDIERHHHQQLECEGQGWPSKREGDGDHCGSLRIYVRRRHRG